MQRSDAHHYFHARPPITKFIDTDHSLEELPAYNSFEPAPEDFQTQFLNEGKAGLFLHPYFSELGSPVPA